MRYFQFEYRKKKEKKGLLKCSDIASHLLCFVTVGTIKHLSILD